MLSVRISIYIYIYIYQNLRPGEESKWQPPALSPSPSPHHHYHQLRLITRQYTSTDKKEDNLTAIDKRESLSLSFSTPLTSIEGYMYRYVYVYLSNNSPPSPLLSLFPLPYPASTEKKRERGVSVRRILLSKQERGRKRISTVFRWIFFSRLDRPRWMDSSGHQK